MSLLISRTLTCTFWPGVTTSLGWLMRLVQLHLGDVHQAFDAFLELAERAVGHDVDHLGLVDRADRVLGLDVLPRAEASFCFRPRAIFSLSLSIWRTLTSISWSILSISLGWLMRPQDMSVMCSRPSMPPRSMNAPKSAMFLTVPLMICADLRGPRASSSSSPRAAARSSCGGR